ncbi:S26 family signal peptidase [Streptomyces sp. NPDC048507]|uniref:S26 family signal peptidase n=1 Tax=Streptomyces sp. NPDC048507 TaxID=3365560 RepID=UPI003713F2CE
MRDELPRPWRWAHTASRALIALAVIGFVAGSVTAQFGYGYSLLYEANGTSMAGLFPKGERVAGEPVAPRDVRRGDVVFFTDTVQRDHAPSVARVVALGGDVLGHRPGEAHLTLNGKPLAEPHLPDGLTPQQATGSYAFTVPPDRFAVLDDADSAVAFTRDLAAGGSTALAASLVRGRVIGHTSDPTVRMMVVDGAVSGTPYLLSLGVVGLIAVRVALRRARARRVYPWTEAARSRS